MASPKGDFDVSKRGFWRLCRPLGRRFQEGFASFDLQSTDNFDELTASVKCACSASKGQILLALGGDLKDLQSDFLIVTEISEQIS